MIDAMTFAAKHGYTDYCFTARAIKRFAAVATKSSPGMAGMLEKILYHA